jgi:hypothetical protein
MRKVRPINDSRGSALIGAVALSVLMAIAGISFLQVTAISINNETAALENEKAFQAAESGIWIGARWLRSFPTFLTLTSAYNGTDIGPFGSRAIPINGMDVYVTMPVHIGVDNIPAVSIVANVYKKGSSPSAATFKKRIIVGDVRSQDFGAYCTFYDGYQSTSADDSTNGQWNSADAWGGWGSSRVFNGRFHMNNMNNKLLDNTPRFNGRVTVAKPCARNNYGTGHDSNNYNSGIFGYSAGGTPTTAELDNIFTDRYIPNVDQIKLTIPRTNAASIDTTTSISTFDKIRLPASSRDDGYGPNQYRPTLYFDGPNAFYEWKDAGGYHRDTVGPLKGGTINGKIFLSSNNLNVYSTANGVTGRVTVATTTGRSIVPVGNLVTSDYNLTTGTVPSNSTNMIGLISGGYVAFNKTWTKRFSGAGADAMKNVSEQVTGGGAPGPDDGVGTLHMSAAIIAVENFNDVLRNGDGNNTQAYRMKGCEWWDGMWMQQPASGDFNSNNNHCEDYGFKLYGNHILGGYARTVWTTGGAPDPTRGCNGALSFTHDQRMLDGTMQPPGFPTVLSSDNLLVLKIKKWAESNTYN